MNILITGCNGQLGNEMQVLQKDYPEHHWFNTDVNELDITDSDAINRFVEEHEIDGIVNCAAYTAVDKAESNKRLATALNAEAPTYLAVAMAKRDGWMVQISTDYVFDGTQHTPYIETDTPCPNSVYGATKLAGEVAVAKTCPKHVIIRTAWLYSSFGHNFVKTMLHLTATKPQLKVVFDQCGTPTYAGDLAAAIFDIVEHRKYTDHTGVYHFSNEGVTSWYDFTQMIARLAGHTACDIQPCHSSEFPSPVKRPAYSVLDKTKIKATFGLTIPYWLDSLEKCINLIKAAQA